MLVSHNGIDGRMKLLEYLCESFTIDVFMYGANVLLQASMRIA